jgi:hypothetical protein
LFKFGVQKSRSVGVCDATNSDAPTSSLQSDLQDVQLEGELPEQRGKGLHSPARTWTDVYSLVSRNALTLTICQDLSVSFVLMLWETKLWSLRNLPDMWTPDIPV